MSDVAICLEEARFRAVFDVADRQRADAERAMRRDDDAIVVQAAAFDAKRRHGVDVGGDQEILGGGEIVLRQNLDAGARRAERDLMLTSKRAHLFWRAAVGRRAP